MSIEEDFAKLDHHQKLAYIKAFADNEPETPLAYAWRTVEYERKVYIRQESFRDRVALELYVGVVLDMLQDTKHGRTSVEKFRAAQQDAAHAAYISADEFLKVRAEVTKSVELPKGMKL